MLFIGLVGSFDDLDELLGDQGGAADVGLSQQLESGLLVHGTVVQNRRVRVILAPYSLRITAGMYAQTSSPYFDITLFAKRSVFTMETATRYKHLTRQMKYILVHISVIYYIQHSLLYYLINFFLNSFLDFLWNIASFKLNTLASTIFFLNLHRKLCFDNGIVRLVI